MVKKFNDANHILSTKPFKFIEFDGDTQIIKKLNNVVNTFDKKYILNKSIMIENLIKYKVDGDWVERLKNSEKYRRDSSSLESLITRYGETIGEMLFNEKVKKSTITKELYIEKYGEADGIRKWNDLCKSKVSFRKEVYIQKYGEVDGEYRWNDVLNRKINTQKENFKDKVWKNGRTLDEYQIRYGVKDGYKRWRARNKNQSYKVSLQRYIDDFGEIQGRLLCRNIKDNTSLQSYVSRYGDVDGKIKYEENCKKTGITLDRMIEKYGRVDGTYRYKDWLKKTAFSCPSGVSKSSQKLFWSIYTQLNEEIQRNVYFYELNQEYKVFRHLNNSIKLLKLDFKVGNKIIEFDCDYWHNPTADKERDDFLLSKSYKILRVNYDDFIKDEMAVVKKCIDFITDET